MASRLAIIITGVLIWTSQAFARFSSDEFFTLLQKGDYAIISAGKNLNSPADARLTKAQLEMRSQNLESELKLIKVKFHKVTGHYGVLEESFFVASKAEQEPTFIRLGEKFNQESIILGSRGLQKMVYTTGKDKGYAQTGAGMVIAVKGPKDFTEIMTTDGKKIRFSLNFDFDKKCKNKITSYTSCHKATFR